MFLEWWMFVLMLLVYVAFGLFMYNRGYNESYTKVKGVYDEVILKDYTELTAIKKDTYSYSGAVSLITLLVKYGLIVIEQDGKMIGYNNNSLRLEDIIDK